MVVIDLTYCKKIAKDKVMLYLELPEVPEITSEEFFKLSIFNLSSLLVSYRFLIVKHDNDDIYLHTSSIELVELLQNNWRFKNLDWYEWKNIEMYGC
jgi:hypothetical protein